MGDVFRMKIAGIIAEYNPFHQGHAFHLRKARRLTRADYMVVLMSGNYVQRGAPAMFDKYTRAKAALLGGADLVLELPPASATASAEFFASGAVRLLADTGAITDLCFGSECGVLAPLDTLARIFAEEPEPYRKLLREALRLGKSYPQARAWALQKYNGQLPIELLQGPNNLLAIEYLKALRRLSVPIRSHTVQREGAPYHEQQLERQEAASATGIRQAILKSRGVFTDRIREQLPFREIYEEYAGCPPMTEDAFSLLLLERLRRVPGESFRKYSGVTDDLSNRIRNCLDDFQSFSQFTDLLKTRNLTRTAVSRALLHILLGITSCEPPDCLRVLGFRKEAAPLLKLLSARASLPLITSPADERIPENWRCADRLYESVRSLLHQKPYVNEHRRKMLVL